MPDTETKRRIDTARDILLGNAPDPKARKRGTPATSNFDYSGPLSEMVLMGNLAVRFPNERLLWDGLKMEVTNNKYANGYVRRTYREGWRLWVTALIVIVSETPISYP